MQNNQSIFRNKALQHYISSREQSVLPRFIRPKIFYFLWILAALLFLANTFFPNHLNNIMIILSIGIIILILAQDRIHQEIMQMHYETIVHASSSPNASALFATPT